MLVEQGVVDPSMTGFGRRWDKGKAHSIRDSELGKNRAPAAEPQKEYQNGRQSTTNEKKPNNRRTIF
jgi:hypothetical protein